MEAMNFRCLTVNSVNLYTDFGTTWNIELKELVVASES